MGDRAPLVQVKGVSKHLGEGETRVDALRDASLQVHPGQVVALLGPSGSGKTTLLNVIGCTQEPSRHAMPSDLSGGEAQRVAIARALANRPRIILADEPTAALHSHRAGIVMDLPRRVAAELQAAILAVTHDEKIFDRFDRIFHLRDGRMDGQDAETEVAR